MQDSSLWQNRIFSPNEGRCGSYGFINNFCKDIENQLGKYDLLMLDAPVSSGAAKVIAAEMTVIGLGFMFRHLTGSVLFLTQWAGKVYEIDEEIGLGATVKIIHQLLAGVHIAAGAEAMTLAARSGIPLDVMYHIV